LDEIVEISANSWKAKIGTDLRTNSQARQFLSEISGLFGPHGHVSIWIARDGTTPIAYEFHVQYGDKLYPLRADFDEEYGTVSPGSVVEYSALQDLFKSQSASEYYSCAGDYKYLSHWTDEYADHMNIDIFSNNWKARLAYAIEHKFVAALRSARNIITSTT